MAIIFTNVGNDSTFHLPSLVRSRIRPSNQENEDEDIFEEYTWSFGQLVSVFMLLVALLLMVEGCSGKTQIRGDCYVIANCPLQIQSINTKPGTRIMIALTATSCYILGFELSSVDYNKDTRLPQGQANQNTVVPSQIMVAHGLSLPMQISAEPLLSRASSLCQRQFQSEPRYVDNMQLAHGCNNWSGMLCLHQ